MPTETELLTKVLAKEKDLEKENKQILEIGTFLEKQERKELIEEQKLQKELNVVQKYFISQIRNHRFMSQLTIVIAAVLVWRGLWGIFDGIPFISSFVVSAAIGIFLLWLFNKITEAN